MKEKRSYHWRESERERDTDTERERERERKRERERLEQLVPPASRRQPKGMGNVLAQLCQDFMSYTWCAV